MTADKLSIIVNQQSTNSRQRKPAKKQKEREGSQLFDTRAFLTEQFTNAQNVLVLFDIYGVECPSLSAIEKWFTRRSVPGEYLPVLLCILELERGEPFKLAQYFENRRKG